MRAKAEGCGGFDELSHLVPRTRHRGDERIEGQQPLAHYVEAKFELGANAASSLRKGDAVIVVGTERDASFEGRDGTVYRRIIDASAIGPDLAHATALIASTRRAAPRPRPIRRRQGNDRPCSRSRTCSTSRPQIPPIPGLVETITGIATVAAGIAFIAVVLAATLAALGGYSQWATRTGVVAFFAAAIALVACGFAGDWRPAIAVLAGVILAALIVVAVRWQRSRTAWC